MLLTLMPALTKAAAALSWVPTTDGSLCRSATAFCRAAAVSRLSRLALTLSALTPVMSDDTVTAGAAGRTTVCSEAGTTGVVIPLVPELLELATETSAQLGVVAGGLLLWPLETDAEAAAELSGVVGLLVWPPPEDGLR